MSFLRKQESRKLNHWIPVYTGMTDKRYFKVKEILIVFGIVLVWVILQFVVFPKLGVPT